MRLVAFLILAAALTGCETCQTKAACLPVHDWTPKEQHDMADALRNLPAESPLIPAILDYGSMRAMARACEG